MIASKAGWSEDYIRWDVSLARGMAYYHAARVLEGERCRWPGASAASDGWIDKIRERLRKLRGKTTRRG